MNTAESQSRPQFSPDTMPGPQPADRQVIIDPESVDLVFGKAKELATVPTEGFKREDAIDIGEAVLHGDKEKADESDDMDKDKDKEAEQVTDEVRPKIFHNIDEQKFRDYITPKVAVASAPPTPPPDDSIKKVTDWDHKHAYQSAGLANPLKTPQSDNSKTDS